MNKHSNTFPYECKKRGCHKKFTNQASLNYHNKKAHTLLLKQRGKDEEEKEKLIMCLHKNCRKRFPTLKALAIHHDRYSKYCKQEKKDLRKKLSNSKKELKWMRKKILILQDLLTKNNINYKSVLRKELGKKNNGDKEENDENSDQIETNLTFVDRSFMNERRQNQQISQHNQSRNIFNNGKIHNFDMFDKFSDSDIISSFFKE